MSDLCPTCGSCTRGRRWHVFTDPLSEIVHGRNPCHDPWHDTPAPIPDGPDAGDRFTDPETER